MTSHKPGLQSAHDRAVFDSVQHCERELASGHDSHQALYAEVERLREADRQYGGLNFRLFCHDIDTVVKKLHADGFLPGLHVSFDCRAHALAQPISSSYHASADTSSNVVPERTTPDSFSFRQLETNPQRTENDGAIAHLRSAIERAKSGGAPVSILQYGDSHIAAGVEPKTIENAFATLAPVDYHTKAKVGISAEYPLRDKQSWLDQPIKAANPDLVILSFGSNDAAVPVDKEAYERNYQKLVDEIRRRAPQASILIVGPSDGQSQGKTLPGLGTVIQAQREIATRNGIGFFDLRGSHGRLAGWINDWHARQLAAPDKLHFTTKGYQLIGAAICDHLKQQLS